ncbi:translation factor GTPase family protein [Butyrivibrio sp. NC2002]|uniref:translation factor GTPase family protein n=1 Tax=Butyrivibrio sp. NC2002 TaxID=1410610 RepID=UPI00068DB17D|nr:TetM/TetW/TetO/TetS family tetracycline resistance ribosomal protection protein [Butyrivibrio sp. NC2002]
MSDKNINNKHLNIGIYAHVDSGKTTLSEALLFLCGAIRKSGRVDHGDTFLDTYALERSRGITIFSKQAELDLSENTHVTLLDTPGHADFAPETERTMKVLDAAILIISAADSITNHVQLLWKLLSHYEVPVYIFVNKMDQPQADKEKLLKDIQARLSEHCLDFSGIIADEKCLDDPAIQEELAVCDDDLLTGFLENETPVGHSDIIKLIIERKLFPILFGSALKMQGIEDLIKLIDLYAPAPEYPGEFAARIYKISRDPSGTRLSWMKITGGNLEVRSEIIPGEKVDQIRIYSGDKYESVKKASAGQIVAVTGLNSSRAGMGLGALKNEAPDILQPILSSRIILPEGTDTFKAYKQLMEIAEEEPLLSIKRSEETGDISVQIMGQVQMEILKHLCNERFGLNIDFGPGTIVYKETIRSAVEGVGHFEPLRHYAEVHLMLTPLEPGSGLKFDTDCKTDILAKNWQNLILSHLHEFNIKGVLTGSEITDMKITVIGGRAHEKHTEGGDFREATMRAVRQGLMMAENILLEPVYDFSIEVGSEHVGRVLSDIQKMNGSCNPPEIIQNSTGDPDDLISLITGSVPAATLKDYANELISFTHGKGRISLSLKGYEPCHNAEEIILEKAYDPESDLNQPTGSVFCSHGVGTVIPWDRVRDYMHVDLGFSFENDNASGQNDIPITDLDLMGDKLKAFRSGEVKKEENLSFAERSKAFDASIQELDRIFEQTYGPVKPRYDRKADEERKRRAKEAPAPKKYKAKSNFSPDDAYILVDGYNVIYANPELKALAIKDMKSARDKLMDILSNFQGFRRETVILVFDAYKVPGGSEHVLKYHNLDVVFTKEAETADQYIERTAHEYSKNSRVTVATSDAIEQVIIYGAGAIRMSAGDFWMEIERTESEIRDKL